MFLCHQFSLLLQSLIVVFISIGTGAVGIGNNEIIEARAPNVGTFQQQTKQVVIVNNGTTTEAEDMAKAMALSKTFFWLELMEKWVCKNRILRHRIKFGLENPFEEFCENWKIMAIAADEYVKSCESKERQKKGKQICTSSLCTAQSYKLEKDENPLEGFCEKPRFFVEQGELLMSSAMEAIKDVYRDLFKWGNGNGMKIKVKFVNNKAWEIANDRMEVSALLIHFENVQIQSNPHFSPPKEHVNDQQRLLDSQKLLHLYEFKTVLQEFHEKWKANKHQSLYSNEKLTLIKQMNSTYLQLWDIGQEIGLASTRICEQINELKEKYVEAQSNVLSENGKAYFKFVCENFDLKPCSPMEMQKTLSQMFVTNLYVVQLPLLKSYANVRKFDKLRQMKKLSVKDPCEEAKLKVWTPKKETDTDAHDQSEADKMRKEFKMGVWNKKKREEDDDHDNHDQSANKTMKMDD